MENNTEIVLSIEEKKENILSNINFFSAQFYVRDRTPLYYKCQRSKYKKITLCRHGKNQKKMRSFSEPEKNSSLPMVWALKSDTIKQVDISLVDDWFVNHVLPLEPALMRLLCKYWHQHDEAEEIRQDIYVRIYEHSLRNGLPKNTASILMATARYLIDEEKRCVRLASLDSIDDVEISAELKVDELSLEVIEGTTEELHLLQVAINDLPPRCLEVVKLRKIEGYSKKKIANNLDMTEITVEQYLQHGLLVLAQTLYEQGLNVLRSPFARRRIKENDT